MIDFKNTETNHSSQIGSRIFNSLYYPDFERQTFLLSNRNKNL